MSRKIVNILVLLTAAILAVAILANSMTKATEHDEQMYCAAGVLMSQGKMIYRDFSYVAQMPYHPLLLAGLFKVFDTSYYLLTARLVSSVCDIIVALCIFGIYRRVFGSASVRGAFLGLAGAILYVFNPFVDYANGFAWNHDVVIACVMVSVWIFQTTELTQKSRYWRIAATGALLMLGTCMRITTALVQLLFFAFLVCRPAGPMRETVKRAAAFLIGGAIVLLWPILVIAHAPRAFFLNVFQIPVLNGQFLHQIGWAYGKSELIQKFLTTPGCIVLILIAVYLVITLVVNRGKLKATDERTALLVVLLVVVFFIIAFIPVTMWLQYLAVPVPFLIISFAYPLLYLKRLGEKRYFRAAIVLIGASVFFALFFYPVVLYRIPRLFALQNWVPVKVHRVSQDIAERANEPKLVLTLAPLSALEGGCGIYDEFSAGVFVYRIADYLSPVERAITHTAGPEALGALLEKAEPSAVVLGVEPEFLEEPIFRAAIEPDRKMWEVKIYQDGPTVYFRR